MKLCLPTIIKIRAHTGITSPSQRSIRETHIAASVDNTYDLVQQITCQWHCLDIFGQLFVFWMTHVGLLLPKGLLMPWVVLEVIAWLKFNIQHDTGPHYVYISKIDLKSNSVCDEDVIERSGQTRASDLRGWLPSRCKLCCLSPPRPRDVIRTLLCNCPPKDGVFSLLELLSHKTVSIWLAGKCRLIHNWL